MSLPELNHAIDHTTLSRLQSVLKQVCESLPAAAALVEEHLLAPPPTVIDLTDDSENAVSAPPVLIPGAKRQRYAMCENCKQEFDVTENEKDSCQYHDDLFSLLPRIPPMPFTQIPGELSVDTQSSTWDDWDQRCYGTIDNDLFDEYPEGFIWECCNESGDAEGCVIHAHEVDETFDPLAKKRRVWE
ncbi:hypothetical protein E4T48_00990 [Aureobasidium sp. EXF-10727]|nr:hypothetical protein E4T48_00990 [Aureobasidium sp. EXF-10727]